MPDATITSTASTFGTITGTFAADQSTVTGTISGIIPGTLTGSVGVPGPQGQQGIQGPPGPVGPAGPGSTWGTITGTLSSQTDLQSALDAKQNVSAMSAYLTKADNLASVASTSTARSNLGLGSLDTPTFAGVNIPGSGTSVANLGATSLTINQQGYGQFTIQPSQGIVFPNGTTQVTAFTSALLSGYATESWVTAGFAPLARGLPASGTVGQVLTKQSGADYDSAWATLIPGDRYLTSSTTSLTINNANKTLTIGTGLSYTPTQSITISYDASHHMHGEVLTYNSGTGVLTVDINHHTGSGTYASWVVNVGGVVPATSVTWGSITGTLGDQTDLATALNSKLETTTAASTYQTIAGMSSYLTTTAAAATYQTQAAMASYATESWVTSQGYLTDAPSDGQQYARKDGAWDIVSAGSSYITSVTSPLSVTSGDLSIDLTGYATESWVTSQGYITSVNLYPLTQDLGYDTSSNDGRLLIDGVFDPTSSGFSSSRLNFGSTTPSSPLNGDLWSNGSKFRYTLGGTTYDIASESYVTTRGYITSAALSPYLLSSTAASTYYLQTNPAGYINTTTLGNGSAPAGEDILDALQNAVAPSTSNPYATEGYTDSSISSFAATLSSTYATIASPSLTGVPLSTTASPGTNTQQIATTAFVTAAVPAFGATSDIKEPVSTTKAASIDNVREMLLSPAFQLFYFGAGNTGTSGTGASVNNNGGRWKEYVSPNTGVAGHAKGVFDSTSSSIGFAGYQRGANLTSRDWSKKVWMAGRCMIGHFSLTTYNGSANTFARISLGGYSAIGAGDMSSANRGIGWKLQGGGSSALELQVSNGSTVTTVTSSFTPTLKQVFDWEIYSDGAGNVTLYVNDSQVATTTDGPTGTQTSGLYMEGVDSTASSTAAFILNNLGTKIYYGI